MKPKMTEEGFSLEISEGNVIEFKRDDIFPNLTQNEEFELNNYVFVPVTGSKFKLFSKNDTGVRTEICTISRIELFLWSLPN